MFNPFISLLGQRETEIQTLLIENEIYIREFAPNILNDLPLIEYVFSKQISQFKWSIVRCQSSQY
jgi:hypothetical protein